MFYPSSFLSTALFHHTYFYRSLNHSTRLINVVASNKLGSSDRRMSIPVSAAADLWLVTAGRGSLADAESSGAADLVTAAPTGPIYQLIWGIMHYQPGSREPGQNIAIARNHSGWKEGKSAGSQSNGQKDLGSVMVSVLISLLSGCGT